MNAAPCVVASAVPASAWQCATTYGYGMRSGAGRRLATRYCAPRRPDRPMLSAASRYLLPEAFPSSGDAVHTPEHYVTCAQHVCRRSSLCAIVPAVLGAQQDTPVRTTAGRRREPWWCRRTSSLPPLNLPGSNQVRADVTARLRSRQPGVGRPREIVGKDLASAAESGHDASRAMCAMDGWRAAASG